MGKKALKLTGLCVTLIFMLALVACGADNESATQSEAAQLPATTTDTTSPSPQESAEAPTQQGTAFNLPESITGGRAYQVFELDEPVPTGINGAREWVFGSNITFVAFPEEYAERWPQLDLAGRYAIRVPVSITNLSTNTWNNGLWRAYGDFERFNPNFENAFAVTIDGSMRNSPLVQAFDGHEEAINAFGRNNFYPGMVDYGYYYLFFYEGDGDYWVRHSVSHIPGVDYHFVRIPIQR